MAEAMRDVGPVQVVLGEKSGKYPDGNQVIVTGRDTKAVFDTPLVANRIPQELDGTDLIVLGHMHEDHAAGLHLLPKAQVFAHSGDLVAVQSWEGLSKHYGYRPEVLATFYPKIVKEFHYTPRPDAVGYEDGQTWDLGGVHIRAWHMPGHTAGHSVLLVEPEGVAFIGDIDLSSFGPYYGDGCSSLAAFRRTLERVAEIPARVWVTSHHKGVITDRQEFLHLLGAFRDKIARREEALLAELGLGPRTMAQLVAHRFLFPPGAEAAYLEEAERYTTLAHLTEWMAEGRVVQEGMHYRLARSA
jgi:glyoxylase-like metal-dependent hydrolase (beta-lactamase superfamily II)